MDNTKLELTNKIIKQLCKDPIDQLLLLKLETWYRYFDGVFCKSLNEGAPAPLTPLIEELDLTPSKYKTSAARVIAQYPNENAVNRYSEQFGDPFQGHYYLSYLEPENGLITYFRNDDLFQTQLSKQAMKIT